MRHFFLNPVFKSLLFVCSFLSFINLSAFSEQSSLESARPIIFTHPRELDWRSLPFETVNYSRIPIDGGAAVYTLPSQTALKFSMQVVFPQSVFSLPVEDRTSYGAMVDLLLLGGSGKLDFDKIQTLLSQNGINIETSFTPNGQLMVSVDALNDDFNSVLNLLKDMFFSPQFDPAALALWKQQKTYEYTNLINANTLEKQTRFIDNQAFIAAFGSDHYFSKSIKRMSPREINKVTNEKVIALYQKTFNKNGLQAWISGGFSQKNLSSFVDILTKIKSQQAVTPVWLPGRELIVTHADKIPTVIIQKDDMTQCNISLRYFTKTLGKLNPLEETQYKILTEIFSSTGGIIGNDRFSKKLRAESGLSYAPRAYLVQNVVYPNTNVGGFYLNFQSPNERLSEAVSLAKTTWETFLKQGISAEELNISRTALMNRLLATENTIFNKSEELRTQILKEKVPSPTPIETNLVNLDQTRDVKPLNLLLSSLAAEKPRAVLVIMGNPSAAQIAALKKDSHLFLEKVINFNALKNQYE